MSRGFSPSVIVLAVVAAWHPACAQNEIAIEGYSCREILREAGPQREIAVAFIHGYVLGKAGAAKIEVERLNKQTRTFIERCIDSPQAGAIETMTRSGDGTR